MYGSPVYPEHGHTGHSLSVLPLQVAVAFRYHNRLGTRGNYEGSPSSIHSFPILTCLGATPIEIVNIFFRFPFIGKGSPLLKYTMRVVVAYHP